MKAAHLPDDKPIEFTTIPEARAEGFRFYQSTDEACILRKQMRDRTFTYAIVRYKPVDKHL